MSDTRFYEKKTDINMPDLMAKLTEEKERHITGAARVKVTQGPQVDMEALKEGMAKRADEIIAAHEEEAREKEAREANRRRMHPDEWEKLQDRRPQTVGGPNRE